MSEILHLESSAFYAKNIMHIDAPKGQSYLYAEHPANQFQGELEVLLPQKLRYKVEKVVDKDKISEIKDLNNAVNGFEYPSGHKKIGGDWYYKDKKIEKEDFEIIKHSLVNMINHSINNRKNVFKFSIENPYVLIPFYLYLQQQNREQ